MPTEFDIFKEDVKCTICGSTHQYLVRVEYGYAMGVSIIYLPSFKSEASEAKKFTCQFLCPRTGEVFVSKLMYFDESHTATVGRRVIVKVNQVDASQREVVTRPKRYFGDTVEIRTVREALNVALFNWAFNCLLFELLVLWAATGIAKAAGPSVARVFLLVGVLGFNFVIAYASIDTYRNSTKRLLFVSGAFWSLLWVMAHAFLAMMDEYPNIVRLTVPIGPNIPFWGTGILSTLSLPLLLSLKWGGRD